MKLDDFKKLEGKINSENFHDGYKNIDRVMYYLSMFGHLASIFLAYFLVFNVISSAIDNTIVAGICSVILLFGLELLKRELFDKFSIQFLKFKNFASKEVLPLLIISTMLVSVSFYATISGAKEFSSKEKEIVENSNKQIDTISNTIKSKYDLKIKEYEDEIKLYKLKIEQKDTEQTNLENGTSISPQQRQRIKDLKDEKVSLKNDISNSETKIKEVKSEAENEVGKAETDIMAKTDDKKNENSSNTLMFIFISSIIEILIIAGVYFNEYYKHRSYKEFKNKIDKDSNFQTWNLYNSVLDVIFTDDTKMNDKLPSSKGIIDICKVNGIIVLQKDLTSLFKLLASLGIIKNSGSVKYIVKNKDVSVELVMKHFKIK